MVELLAGLKPKALADVAAASPADLAEWSAGLARILNAVPAGTAKGTPAAQVQRVLGNDHLFRHPVLELKSHYKETDLLRELAVVSHHADAGGMVRLVQSLKAGSSRVSGNRYALSVTADLITKGATEVKFIGNFVGKWGTKGAAELDLVCKEAGQWVIYEIKSTYKAIGSQSRLLGWQNRVKTGWLALGLGPTPKIKIMSPLENQVTNSEIPRWLKDLTDPPTSTIKYEQGIGFK